MADIAVSFEAADVFGLASNFVAQGSPVAVSYDHATMLSANSDINRYSAVFNTMTSVTARYKWSADTGLGAALGSLCGSVSNSYMLTSIQVESSATDFPVITITGHQHTNNTHTSGNVYDIPAAIQTLITGAYGAYDFAGKNSATVSVISGVYTIACQHTDQEGADGNHWVGTNHSGEERLDCQYTGNVATPGTVTGWTVEESETEDGNEQHDTSRIVAVRAVARS